MLYLQATQKALDALGIGKEPLNPPGQTTSVLGNWMVNIVPIGSRQAFLFMSSRSLLCFPIMIGAKQPSLQDMPAFLSHGFKQLSQTMKVTSKSLSLLLQDFDEIAYPKPSTSRHWELSAPLRPTTITESMQKAVSLKPTSAPSSRPSTQRQGK